MEEKCDVYEVNGILGYRREKHMQQLHRTIKEKKPGLNKKREHTNKMEMGSEANAKTSPRWEKTITPSQGLGKKKKKNRRVI